MKTRAHWIFTLAAPLVITLLVFLLAEAHWLKRFEYSTLDWRFQLRAKQNREAPDSRITLVGIDDASTNQLGRWPFPRSYHAELLQELAKEHPSVVAWDILFVDPDQNHENDVVLGEAARLFPNFISGAVLAPDPMRPDNPHPNPGLTDPLKNIQGDIHACTLSSYAQLPIDELRNATYFGFVDCTPFIDGVRRAIPLVVVYNNQVYPSLSLRTAMCLLGVRTDEVEVNLGHEIILRGNKDRAELRIPIDRTGQMLVSFRYQVEDFSKISYSDLVYEFQGRATDPSAAIAPKVKERIQSKLLFFGLTATGHGDTGATPLGKSVPLPTVHLNAIHSILHQDFVHSIALGLWLPLYLLGLLALAQLMVRVPFFTSIGVGFIAIPSHILISSLLFINGSTILPIVVPAIGFGLLLVAVVAFRYGLEERDKRRIKASLGSYLSEKVMNEVLNNPDGVKLGGTKKEITILFCDIRGFTRYCEKRDPEKVLQVLNEYLEAMTEIILKYEGTLDKYIGDAIMAFWGAPQDQPDHAQRAVCAAVEMRYALSKFKSRQVEMDSELFECGIGVHTGEALVGNMGSSRHMNYTAIGATINLAARLEALTKQFNARIIISEATRKQIQGDFTITSIGDVTLPGFTTSTTLYTVEAAQDISSALNVGRILAKSKSTEGDDTPAEPIWKPAPIPEDER